jgi:hypothetical protein
MGKAHSQFRCATTNRPRHLHSLLQRAQRVPGGGVDAKAAGERLRSASAFAKPVKNTMGKTPQLTGQIAPQKISATTKLPRYLHSLLQRAARVPGGGVAARAAGERKRHVSASAKLVKNIGDETPCSPGRAQPPGSCAVYSPRSAPKALPGAAWHARSTSGHSP